MNQSPQNPSPVLCRPYKEYKNRHEAFISHSIDYSIVVVHVVEKDFCSSSSSSNKDQTCFIVAKSNGCKSDHSIVNAFSERPAFQPLKHNGRDKGEEHEKDDDADQHADNVLAERPRASIFAVAETARSEEALIERSTQPPSQSS